MRDKAWLTKKVTNEELKTFSINANDAIAQTIAEEVNELFPAVEQVENNGTIEFILEGKAEQPNEAVELQRKKDGYILHSASTKGLLYGFYQLYQRLILKQEIPEKVHFEPSQHLRMINHWDNIDGSIERGYAGESIFYKDNQFRRDFKLIRSYARLLASVGINALSINNVNVHALETRLILEEKTASYFMMEPSLFNPMIKK